LLGPNVNNLVYGGAVRPNWLPQDRFWYRNAVPEGFEFVVVDPARRTRTRAFDHGLMAAAISAATGQRYEAQKLPFQTIEFVAGGTAIRVRISDRLLECSIAQPRCAEVRPPRPLPPGAAVSPDGRWAAFVRDYNLWVQDLTSGRELQLTQDGTEHFGYATDNAGWTRSNRAIVLWSPDSKKLATYQQDERHVGDMYLVETRLGRPSLIRWKYPLPEDSVVQLVHRVVIHLDGPRVVRLMMPPDQHRSTVCDHIVCGGRWADVAWSEDGRQLAFVSSSRDHKVATLRLADPETGEVRGVLEERVSTFYESGFGVANWRVFFRRGQVLWYSQRDDWGHLYLYDLASGRLLRQLTQGSWNVTQVLRSGEASGELWFLGVGREAGRDPYFRHLYRLNWENGSPVLLTPEDADHEVSFSPSGRYFVDVYSRPDVPPVSLLRDANGRVIMELERADISRLLATGWTPPLPFKVKARDGRTDLYGLMYLPSNFDSTRRYPIINNVYPGPQTGSVGSRQFQPARGDTRALAELGFVVVQVDAMGTPLRSKSFHAAYYGNMGDNGLPDQVAAMQQLAARYRWIDLERAGIYGHSGGGYAAAGAILRYPDFFKVAVSQAGNHDNRLYEDDWGEKWQGLLQRYPDGSTNYDNQANQLLAANLKGKLLLAHGSMDDNVPPYGTLLLVDALIRANKDFDLIIFPNRRHGFGSEPYMIRRRWDYFVRHLLGAEPPSGYVLGLSQN
jgi:dipeptidyl aminopeptidase/acylaminoacyl peptidase